MSEDLHPASLKYFFNEELYLIGEKTDLAITPQKPSAVETSATEPKQATKTPAKRQHLIIILKHSLPDLEISQKELLTKITGAVKIDLNSATSINESQYKSDPEQLKNFDNILSFGVELAATTSKYSVTKKGDQKFLSSDSLAALEQAIALKGKLWKAMQEMFGVV